MPQTLNLIVYNSPLFPAHWSLFIPHTQTSKTGKRIHATGDAANGFTIEFDRAYDLREETRSCQIILLGELGEEVDVYFGPGEKEGETGTVVRGESDGHGKNRTIARDRIEEIAAGVDVPGRSLVAVDVKGPRKMVNVKNCQTWLRDVIAALVLNEVLGRSALEIVESAPKN